MHKPHGNNTIVQCTIGALLLRTTDNSQGGYYVYRPNTGHQFNRKMCTPLTMTC